MASAVIAAACYHIHAGLSNALTAVCGVGYTGELERHGGLRPPLPCMFPAQQPTTATFDTLASSLNVDTQRAAPASPLAGSYIFSQTLFGSRMGVDSRLMGAILTGGAGNNLSAPGWPAACHWHTLRMCVVACSLLTPGGQRRPALLASGQQLE